MSNPGPGCAKHPEHEGEVIAGTTSALRLPEAS